MTSKMPAVISVVLTTILLIVFGIVSVLFEMLALNGASENQGITAMGISLACQGVGAILIGVLVWRLTNLFISKFNWNKIAAVVVTVLLGTMIGTGISFLSLIISIPVAGVR
jgi:hypothetical protein